MKYHVTLTTAHDDMESTATAYCATPSAAAKVAVQLTRDFLRRLNRMKDTPRALTLTIKWSPKENGQ